MIRSFDYAAAVVKRKSVASQAHVADPQSRRIPEHVRRARRRSASWRATREVLPAEDADCGTQNLLRLFLIEKAAYEIAYEAANRPAWIDVPLHGLAQLIAQVPS